MGQDNDALAPRSGWFARAYYTPLSDALRGQLTGRLDLRAEIDAVGLPASLSRLVWDVVRQTRLWRSEKSEVARELVTHFADGLAAGRSDEELLRDFGSAQQAARLIGKAKRRNRPLPWHVWHFAARTTLVALALFLVAYAWLGVRYYVGRPAISHNYWLEINAARGIPDGDRAWPMYREALLKLGREQRWIDTDKVARGPQHKSWDETVEQLKHHREAVELIRSAAAKPRLGYYLGDKTDIEVAQAAGADWLVDRKMPLAEENKSLVEARLEGPQATRTLARVLAVDARVAATEGDGARATEDQAGMVGMASQLFEPHATLVEQLIGMAIFNFAMDNLGRILASTPAVFTDDQLTKLVHRIAAFRDRAPAVDFSGERMMFDDILQRAYTDDGNGDGRITPAGMTLLNEYGSATSKILELCDSNRAVDRGTWLASRLLSPAVASWVGRREENSRLYHELLAEITATHDSPAWQWDRHRIDDIEKRVEDAGSSQNYFRYYLVNLLLPAVSAVFSAGERTNQQRDATELVIALELWHRRHGAWPERIQQLVPELLPAVPLDRADGKPLRYLLRDGKPLVYSIGADHRDDDGRANPEDPELPRFITYGPRPVGDSTGDWILWPPLPEQINEEDEE
jgi:hypothetical protein